MRNRIKKILQQETVLTAAFVLAVVSALIVPPDEAYFGYIDWNTLLLLFSLMAVMAGFQKLGIFKTVGRRLLSKTRDTRQLLLVLVFLPFFFSMLITNDVALITFVPFAIIVLRLSQQEKLLVPLVVLQTLAANLGSMLTPMGNPQNLYLYAKSGISLTAFLQLMLPYTIASGLCLSAGILMIKKEALNPLALTADSFSKESAQGESTLPKFICYSVGFLLCLLCVAKLLAPIIAAAIILFFLLLTDSALLKRLTTASLAPLSAFLSLSAIWDASSISARCLRVSSQGTNALWQSSPARSSAMSPRHCFCLALQTSIRCSLSARTSAASAR